MQTSFYGQCFFCALECAPPKNKYFWTFSAQVSVFQCTLENDCFFLGKLFLSVACSSFCVAHLVSELIASGAKFFLGSSSVFVILAEVLSKNPHRNTSVTSVFVGTVTSPTTTTTGKEQPNNNSRRSKSNFFFDVPFNWLISILTVFCLFQIIKSSLECL